MCKEVIDTVMFLHADHKMPLGWIFQEDNDPRHNPKSVQILFQSKGIRIKKFKS